jgi:predicted AlkP superfamily phosphohydrolase/phosphomutase
MFNDWLIRHGYLVLHDRPATPTPLTADRIDWSRTRAWGEGGYYGRLFLNVRGREPRGVVDPGDVERLLRELTAAIAEIEDPAGGRLGAEARRPADLYREVRGVAPELMVYFGDLRWRAAGSVGHPVLHSADNDSGPDDCNHDWNGVFVLRDGENDLGGRHLEGLRLIDLATSMLAASGLEPAANMQGRPIEVPLT